METTLVNLKILSQIKPFDRVNTRRELFTIQRTHMHFLPSWFLRWMDGSNRESDFGRIRDLYQTCEKFLSAHPDNKQLVVHMENSLGGLRNLKKTYEYDTTFLARIDTLAEHIRNLYVLPAEEKEEELLDC